MLSKKNILSALFLLIFSTTLNAGFPINPDGQEESIRFGREFNAVGRIDWEGRGIGSGVLIDVASIGLPQSFQNRVVATVSHVFLKFIDSFGYKRFPVKHHSPESIECATASLSKYSFKINVETDLAKPENYQAFGIQQVYMCDDYHPYNREIKLLDQVAFAILNEPIENVIPIRLMETGAADYLGKNVYQVGYGVSGFMNSRRFFYDGVKRAGGATINKAYPSSSLMEYELKFDHNGQAPLAALSPGGDSITFEMDHVETTMEISRLDSSINSPVFQQLLKHFNVIQIDAQIERELSILEKSPYNRTALYNEWHGVKLVSPIRLTKAPKNPSIVQSGDSGGASLYHNGREWGLAGLILGSDLSIRRESAPLSCYERILRTLYSRKFLHRFLPERSTAEPDVTNATPLGEFKTAISIEDRQEALTKLGVRSYARTLDQLDDTSRFTRTVSRLKHKFKRTFGLYEYPGFAVSIVTPYSYALKFAETLNSEESLKLVNTESSKLVAPKKKTRATKRKTTAQNPLVLYPRK